MKTPPDKLIFASGNPGKVREVQELLAGLHLTLLPQSHFQVPEAEETGLTFVENALIKARNAAIHSGLPAIADDSGLAVDILDGEPGVWSARYAGLGASDQANLDKLLLELKDVPPEECTARYICVMVYLAHPRDPTPIICEGIWEGRITLEVAGENGFGYDPAFWVPTHGCTSAQLPREVKNALSHRGQALRALVAALRVRTLHLPAGG
mgnify:CR=1 FL=1